MDFLQLFNGVIDKAKPVTAPDSYAQSMQDQLADLNLDSLDVMMVAMYFGEIYGIEEETMQEGLAGTVQDFQQYLEKHATQKPESVEAALEHVG